ncbi:hypothetical protein V6N11_063776 [Hibiscus sabdariffa]|uniref:Uncharacterized protein n=2 Tax=Hibiscus sabdariffa TaxID=183260 RepID=A0ABR2PM14_9ROSI
MEVEAPSLTIKLISSILSLEKVGDACATGLKLSVCGEATGSYSTFSSGSFLPSPVSRNACVAGTEVSVEHLVTILVLCKGNVGDIKLAVSEAEGGV